MMLDRKGMQPLQSASLQSPGEPLARGSASLHAVFIQNVAHELRTPLAILHGYSNMLHDGELGMLLPEQQQAVSNIVRSADKLRRQIELIEILLSVEARMARLGSVSLTEIASRVAKTRRTDMAPNLKLELYHEADLPLVSGNEHQLKNVVDCLLDNALKFTAGGLVTVELYAEDGWVCLAVSDTGVGMSPEEMARILMVHFYQGDGSSTRRYGGYGLGLTVTGSVIHAHGGQIEIASQLGKGSRFTIRLPALPAETQIVEQEERPVKLRRVLIVDDEENIAMILQAALEKIPDCEVSIATNAQLAVRLFEERPFDLLITDFMMPDVDGITLASRIRQLYPQTAIVMVTAYGDNALRERAANAAIRHVLDKPVQLGDIRDVALSLLSDLDQS